MEKAKLLCLCFLLAGGIFSCTSKDKNNATIANNSSENTLTLCDYSKVTDTIDVPLSEWVEDCQLVHFDNSDSALFKFWWPTITDHYIGIRQHGGVYKLFDREGKYLYDIGKIGQGPGEYSGSLYSEVIDETGKAIYLAPFSNSSKLYKYNIDGTFEKSIDLKNDLNKSKIALNSDGGISLVNLCFDKKGIFSAVVDANDQVTTYLGKAEDITNPLDEKGNFSGFTNEIWSYGNTSDLTYMITGNDTLYIYDAQAGASKPLFALSNLPEKEDFFKIYFDLPQKYIVNLGRKGAIAVDKKTQDTHYIRLKNDKFGGIGAPLCFTNGYFFAMYEPIHLMNAIEKRLSESRCTDNDKKVLKELLGSLNEDDNNVMFVGKLKK